MYNIWLKLIQSSQAYRLLQAECDALRRTLQTANSRNEAKLAGVRVELRKLLEDLK